MFHIFLMEVIDVFIYSFRGHPKVIAFNMMHVADYSNMKLSQMKKTIDNSKNKDKAVAKAIE